MRTEEIMAFVTPGIRWRTHTRLLRRSLTVPALLALLSTAVLVANGQSLTNLRVWTALYGEVLPPLLGVLAARMVLHDAARELMLAAPYSLWRVLLERSGLLLGWAMISWGSMLVVAWLLAAQSVLDLVMLFVGGAAMCWAGVGLGLWTALRCHNFVVSGAVIVSVWAVGLMVREQRGVLGLPVNWWSMVGVCGVGLVFWWLSARSTHDDEALLLQHSNNG